MLTVQAEPDYKDRTSAPKTVSGDHEPANGMPSSAPAAADGLIAGGSPIPPGPGEAQIAGEPGALAGTAAFGALLHYVAILCGVGLVMWLLAAPFGIIAGRVSPMRYIRAVAPSQAVAFSTQSSLASLPAMLKATETLGVPAAHSGVALPIAVAIFRWTGPAMNFAVAIYVAHLLGIELDDHIRNVVAALQPISAELGLPS